MHDATAAAFSRENPDICNNPYELCACTNYYYIHHDLELFGLCVAVATHCITLQHTAAHCNTLQHTATP